MTDTAGVFAKPWEYDPPRWTQLLDAVGDHRPWFRDEIWEDPAKRRQAAANLIVDALTNGRVWEVFAGQTLVGVVIVNQVDFNNTAQCHFVFFDHTLANKRQLCLNLMAWLFDEWHLETLRVEVPTYARSLAHWVHKKLGFRYEAEARDLQGSSERLTRRQAELGSRKYRTTQYKGEWHDGLLLSITRQEFDDFYGRHEPHARGTDPTAV